MADQSHPIRHPSPSAHHHQDKPDKGGASGSHHSSGGGSTSGSGGTSGGSSSGGSSGGTPSGRAHLYVFSGGNSATLSDKSYIAGTNLTYYWSQLEQVQGHPDFSVIDRDMKPWVDAEKDVILRISTAGWTAWQPPYSKQGTPQWVFDAGVKHIQEIDGAILPEYWNPVFLQHYNDFITAFAARYDGNPHVAFIQAGVGVGGETKPDSRNDNPGKLALWQGIGYTDPVWFTTIQSIATMYKAFKSTPVALMPDNSFLGKTAGYDEQKVVQWAITEGFWLQDNGLVMGQTLGASWHQAKGIIAEARNKTGGSLQGLIQLAISQGASYVLCFLKDLEAADPAMLSQFAVSK